MVYLTRCNYSYSFFSYALQQAMQPSPQMQQLQQAQLQFQQSQTAALAAQAQESQARATKLAAEAAVVPEELQIDKINAITRNLKEGDQEDKEFERRMRVADALLKEEEIKGKNNVDNAERNANPPRPNQPQLQRPVRPVGQIGEADRGTQ